VTLLLRLVGEVIGGAVIWLTIVAAIAAATALAIHAIFPGGLPGRSMLLVAVAGAAVAVALAHRVGAADPLGFSVWRRDLLVTWAIVGAAASVAAVLARGQRTETHRPPEGASER
jgi:hypothetical protein